MKKLLLTISILLLTASLSFAQKEITIDEECVYLDDVTASHVPHIKVQCGIKAGSQIVISKEDIQSHIDNAGIKGSVISDVLVVRQWEKISYEKVSALIEEEYKKAYPDISISIEQLRIPDNLYDIDGNIKIICDTSKFGGSYAQVSMENSKYQIYYYVKGYKNAYVTKERVKAGDVLSSKVTLEKVDITNIKNSLVTNIDNMAAARAMPAGKVLTTDLIQDRPALKKGEAVKIIVSNGILHIETQGVVEENAMPGKPVLVRNLSSQKVIAANYIGNGVVKAEF